MQKQPNMPLNRKKVGKRYNRSAYKLHVNDTLFNNFMHTLNIF